MKLKSISNNVSSIVATGIVLASPYIAKAQDAISNGLNNSSVKSQFGSGRILGSSNAFELITNIIKLMLTFVGVIAIVFLIIGGFQYITSAGNAEQAEKGRGTIVNAIIGIVVVALSYTIVTVVVNTVQCRGSSFFGSC